MLKGDHAGFPAPPLRAYPEARKACLPHSDQECVRTQIGPHNVAPAFTHVGSSWSFGVGCLTVRLKHVREREAVELAEEALDRRGVLRRRQRFHGRDQRADLTCVGPRGLTETDRKSTRLNSSH